VFSRLEMAEKVKAFSSELRGVFALSDLRNLLQTSNRGVLYRSLGDLGRAGVLSRFCRGFYVTRDFDPLVLSQRLSPDSYVSFGNALARHLLIGSVPRYRIRAAKPGPKRVYTNGEYRIEHLSLKPELVFGYEVIDGVRIALPEKAVLDTLYLYRRGVRFSFDVYTDIDYSRLDGGVVRKYLGEYRNPVFVDYARRLTDA
jgi:predicted transcriptional regulator of viral defense system